DSQRHVVRELDRKVPRRWEQRNRFDRGADQLSKFMSDRFHHVVRAREWTVWPIQAPGAPDQQVRFPLVAPVLFRMGPVLHRGLSEDFPPQGKLKRRPRRPTGADVPAGKAAERTDQGAQLLLAVGIHACPCHLFGYSSLISLVISRISSRESCWPVISSCS